MSGYGNIVKADAISRCNVLAHSLFDLQVSSHCSCSVRVNVYVFFFSLGIDRKQPPMVGFYPLRNASAPPETPDVISSFFSSVSATIATTLPNFVLPTPSFTTPPYAFNTSFSAPAGKIVSSGLATSTYSAALGTHHLNVSAIPTVSPSPTLATFILTDAAGHVSTSISTAVLPSVTLGAPPGWSNGAPSIRIRSDLAWCTTLSSVLMFLLMVW